MNIAKLSLQERRKAAVKKIRTQVGETAEELLMMGVIEKAIVDC